MSGEAVPLSPPAKGGYPYQFTVFTAVYNRVALLHRVYDSLLAQTYRDFEWLVVDDGSTEDVAACLAPWIAEGKVPIRFFRKENGGKHTAHNLGVREARGEFFLNLDSDDGCIPQALERFKAHWDGIPDADKPRFSGVTGLCLHQSGTLIGNRFPADVLDSDPLEIRYRYGSRDERWGFTRTDVLRQFPFPEDLQRTYVPESIVWNRMARKYRTRYVNDPLRIHWREGVSQGGRGYPGRNAPGRRLAHLMVLNEETDWLLVSPLRFMRSAVNYSRNSFHLRVPLLEQRKQIDTLSGRVLWTVGIPFGYLAYLLGEMRILRG